MIDFDSLLLAPCMDTFAEPVTYLPHGGYGDPVEGVRGVFDRNATILETTDHGTYSTQSPTLGVRRADFPEGTDFRQGDEFIIRDRRWQVVDVDEESQEGHRVLRLHDLGPASTDGGAD